MAATGLLLVAWVPTYTAAAKTGCTTFPGGGHLGIASVLLGELIIGAAVGVLMGRKTWAIVAIAFAVALPAGVFGLMSWFVIGFHRCWHF